MQSSVSFCSKAFKIVAFLFEIYLNCLYPCQLNCHSAVVTSQITDHQTRPLESRYVSGIYVVPINIINIFYNHLQQKFFIMIV